jgi:hypothetical protein
MAFTYSTLTSAIDDYTQNAGNWGSQIDTIIRQAEERINLAVQIANYNTKTESGVTTDKQSAVVIASTGPGVAEANVTSPVSPLYFKIRSGSTAVASDSTSPFQFLLLKDYNFLQEYAPITDDTTDGAPKYYSFYNDTSNSGLATFAFAPRTDGVYAYEILYYFKPSSIVTDTSGTWLGTHGESALLYACLVEAYTFMKGEADLIQLYDTKFKEGLQLLVNSQRGEFRNATYRDQASRGAA